MPDGHSQEVDCFCHGLGIMERLKHGKCFLVCLQTVCNSPNIDQPVPDTIEAASMEFRIGQRLRAIKRTAEPVSHLSIVAPCPQASDVKQALPFHNAVLDLLGNLQGPFVIASRLLKLADRFVSLSSCPQQCCGWRAGHMLARAQCARKALNSCARCG